MLKAGFRGTWPLISPRKHLHSGHTPAAASVAFRFDTEEREKERWRAVRARAECPPSQQLKRKDIVSRAEAFINRDRGGRRAVPLHTPSPDGNGCGKALRNGLTTHEWSPGVSARRTLHQQKKHETWCCMEAGEQNNGTKTGRRAVVLLSGGLDSATAAAWASKQGWQIAALSVAYGQRHATELDCSRRVAAALGIDDHVVLTIDLATFGGSSLTNLATEVPKGRSSEMIGDGIPSTYVPARNTVLLSLALAMAEARQAEAIVIGVNALDYSGYPDCRPEFIDAFRSLAALATKVGVEGNPIEVLAPLQHLTKAEIIRLGGTLGVDYGLTTSCYDPLSTGLPCGACDSCQLRAEGFAAAGMTDPALTNPAPA